MPAPRLFTRAFTSCFFANLAQGLSYNIFIHFPGFLDGLGAGEVQIGLLYSLTAVAAILARPPIGRTMDTRGRRPVILAGGVVNVLVCAAYTTVGSLGPWIYVVRVVHGLSEAMLFTALFTYAADLVPAARRTQGLALFGVSGMLPISLAGLIGDLVLARASYDVLFLVASGFGLVSLLLSLSLFDAPRASAQVEATRGLGAAIAQPDLRPIWWIGGVFTLALAAVFTFLKLFVEDTRLSSVGGFLTAYTAAALLLRVFFGWLPDQVGPKRVLLPALASLALGFVVLSVADRSYEVVIAGVFFGIGHGYTFPILFGMLVSRARESERGSAMAIFTALFDLGVVLGGPACGWVIDRTGFDTLYALAAVWIVAGSAVFAVWDRHR